MAITLKAGSTANGVDFTTYFDTFLANSGHDDHGGNPTFYGGTSFDGDQLALTYTNDRLILAEGDDLNYTFATHVLAGKLDTLSFGSYGDDYAIDANGLLVDTVSVVTVSGLGLSSPAGVKGDVHDVIYGFMGSSADAFHEIIDAEAQIVHGSKGVDTYVGTAFADKAYGYAGNDDFAGGGGNDLVKGGDGNDALAGDAGADKLYGEAGNDVLTGGGGKDALYGGDGKDAFAYLDLGDSTAKKSGQDVVYDFDVAADRIDVKAIDANDDKAGNQKFRFLGDADFSGKAGELAYDVKGNHTYVSGDVDGDGKADFTIDLAGKHGLEASDFLL